MKPELGNGELNRISEEDEKNKKHWLGLASQLMVAAKGIEDFFIPSKKEIVIDKLGMWKDRNDEIKNIVYLDSGEAQPIQSDCENYWNKDGTFYSSGEKSKYDLIKFISPPEFMIDKPGVYEDEQGNKFIFPSGFVNVCGNMHASCTNGKHVEFYKKNGEHGYSKSKPKIVKFISSTWNFEKGEPI